MPCPCKKTRMPPRHVHLPCFIYNKGLSLQGPHLCMNEYMPPRQVILGIFFNDYLLVKALHTLVFALVHICLGWYPNA